MALKSNPNYSSLLQVNFIGLKYISSFFRCQCISWYNHWMYWEDYIAHTSFLQRFAEQGRSEKIDDCSQFCQTCEKQSCVFQITLWKKDSKGLHGWRFRRVDTVHLHSSYRILQKVSSFCLSQK